jgi:hypothetical protein
MKTYSGWFNQKMEVSGLWVKNLNQFSVNGNFNKFNKIILSNNTDQTKVKLDISKVEYQYA